MKLELKRIARKETYTIGRLFVEGRYLCDTLEDKDRDQNRNGCFDGAETKIYAQTAIPNGTYRVTLEHSPKFSPRYGGRKVPYLHDVPHFEGILIHTGNMADDSAGCILVGTNSATGRVSGSLTAFNKLLPMLEQATARKEEITITVH
ncbi:DUF5675 family protein [uncultured Alistipes sp.]|jgi:hypothetical protein|uniref:DUF5675 family protein n=1 Tax=uncultured Alistipes sp. TaxID=538949 RepID=UPI002635F405|nr:DUF5675 family protein [uncultured Alistipes sp.]